MSLFTSDGFASAAASGKDWREAAKAVLDKLEDVRGKSGAQYTIGFLYISDHLADDSTSILNLFRSVLGVENWVGCVGMGVIGMGEALVDKPAISALIGQIPPEKFCIFPQIGEDMKSDDQSVVKEWLARHTPLLTFVHGDPLAEQDPVAMLADLESTTGAFIVGGLSSSRAQHYQIANAVCENAVCGVFFDQSISVFTTLSQGCSPISPFYTVTRAQDNFVFEIDGRRALDVFQDVLRAHAAQKMGKVSDRFKVELTSIRNSEEIPEEFSALFRGQIHAALPLTQSDQKDFLVRNIMGIDADAGALAISENITTGGRILFVERNDDTVRSDLVRSLENIRERVIAQHGAFSPKAGIYISCIARGYGDCAGESEIAMLREIIGEVPLAGFYAGGEINNARLYGYTGVLILFV